MLVSIGVAIVFFCVLWLYKKMASRMCKSDVDLSGKTIIVTGANTGIGLEIAINLTMRNARVIIACRNEEKGKLALKIIKDKTGKDEVFMKTLDVSSLSSIRRFSDEIHKEEQALQVLINNAGICNLPHYMTEDGLEINMATNHFGPFLLTLLLLDLLIKSSPSRIINTTSKVQSWISGMDLSNVNSEKYFDKKVYMYSKLANVLFTKELSRKLEGTDVTVNCVHPGTVHTELLRYLYFPVNYIMKLISWLCFKSTIMGAQTTIHCAVSEEVKNVTGKYFTNCQIKTPGKGALDDGAARKLWEISEKYTKCNISL